MAAAASAEAQAARLAKLEAVDVEAACREKLAGLDDDLLEYIIQTAAPEGELEIEREDFEEMVPPMLVDAELCADDEAAAALFEELWSAMTGGAAGDAAAPSSEPQLLSGKVSLKTQSAAYEAAASSAHGAQIDDSTMNKEINTDKADDALDGNALDPKAEREAAARLERLMTEVAAETESLEKEMAAAREEAAKLRTEGAGGGALGAIETGKFDLPNPGGGADLLTDAAAVLVPGRRYGLIGRNGKGKSTMLKYLAARRVGGLPPSVSIHYVSQTSDIALADQAETPAEVVIKADVERTVLLEQVAALDKVPNLSAAQDEALNSARDRLEEIGSDGAPGRVAALLKNLGFTEELMARRVKELSGGWRVRVALASALFAKPDLLLMDEPTNHLSIVTGTIIAEFWAAFSSNNRANRRRCCGCSGS